MERNGGLRRASVSWSSGLQRRRQGTASFRDSREKGRQVELENMVRLRDREQFQKKDRDREFRKRRRVDGRQRIGDGGGESYRKNESTGSSDEESYEEAEEPLKIHQKNQMNQPPPPPPPSIRSNNRRSLRTLRSSPVLRASADELIGVPIPRRARSASIKRLHEHWSSGSGGLGQDVNRRRFSTSPVTETPTAPGCSSPSSSGGSSMRKKMKSVEPRMRNSASDFRPSSVIQDDIEFEVAEALFDLMNQSQSPTNIDRDGRNGIDDELERLKAEGGRDETSAFSIQNEQSIEVDSEAVTVDPIEELKKEEISEKEKFTDDQVQKLLCRDEFPSNGEVGPPKESELPSCVKVNACKFQDPTVTKADCGSISVETNKEAKLHIDLMTPPELSSSQGKYFLVDVASNSKDVMEKRENTLKNGSATVSVRLQEEKIETARSSQLPNLNLEKYADDTFVSNGSKQQWGLNEQKILSSNSFLPFPIPMNGWHNVPPHPGYIVPLQAVLPMDGNARSSTVQPPQFKFSKPRSKRSATHHYIALSIQSHHQLVKNSLFSGLTSASNFYGSKQLNLNLESTELNFAPEKLGNGKDKSYEVAKAMNTSTGTTLVPQQATDQSPAHKFFGPALILPFGHNRSASAVNDDSLPSNSALNLCLPAMSFNHQNMAILQKNGSPFPIPPNMALQKKGSEVPILPFFNSSFYSSPVFNVSQNQQHLSLPHASLVQSTSQNTTTSSGSSSRKPPLRQKQTSPNDNKSTSDISKNSLIPNSGQLFSVPIQPMNGVVTENGDSQQKGYQAPALSFSSNPSPYFQMLPDVSRNGYQKIFRASEGKSVVGSANLENGLKGIFEKFPERDGAQSHNFTRSGCTDISASMFDGLARNINMVPSSSPGNSVTIPNFNQHHQQLIQLQKHHMQQMPLNGVKDPIFNSLQWENFPQQVKSSQGQTHISFGNMPVSSASFQGKHIRSHFNSSMSSVIPYQQVDISQSRPGQKSSPACRREVPSILSTCSSQPSELKY